MSHRILVVEDEPWVRDFVADTLSSVGHDVIVAGTITQARRIVDQHPEYDDLCLVLDVVLEESGVAFAQEIIKTHPGFHILLISGYLDDVLVLDPEHVLRASFLRKPFGRQQLLEAVEEACSQR